MLFNGSGMRAAAEHSISVLLAPFILSCVFCMCVFVLQLGLVPSHIRYSQLQASQPRLSKSSSSLRCLQCRNILKASSLAALSVNGFLRPLRLDAQTGWAPQSSICDKSWQWHEAHFHVYKLLVELVGGFGWTFQ